MNKHLVTALIIALFSTGSVFAASPGEYINHTGTSSASFFVGGPSGNTVNYNSSTGKTEIKDSSGTLVEVQVGAPAASGDATTKNYVDTQDGTKADLAVPTAAGNFATLSATGNLTDSTIATTDVPLKTGAVLKAEVDFDVDTTTLDGDDGTGLNVASINLAETDLIIGVTYEVSQGSGEAGDTIEVHITTDNAIGTSSGEIISDTAVNAATNEVYVLATGSGATLFKTSATNQYITAFFKDVGNDGSSATALQGKMTVLYVKQ
jgi:hypothetical protein